MLPAMPDAASDAAWARSQATSPTSSTSGGDAPTNAELQMWADEAIAGNLYEKIMDALSQTRYYQDLNGNDVLDLIPKGLCLSEDQPGYLSCRHCLNKKSRRFSNKRWGGQPLSPNFLPDGPALFCSDSFRRAIPGALPSSAVPPGRHF